MPLTTQRTKRRALLQPAKVRVRHVQVAPQLAQGATVTAGAISVTLTFTPAWLVPGGAVVVGTAGGGDTETLMVRSVFPSQNLVQFEATTAQAHDPSQNVYVTPEGYPREVALGRVLWGSWDGVNGATPQGRGWSEGAYERKLREEGTGQLTFPNSAGSDGLLHRARFQIAYRDDYRMGDEWFEVWRYTHAAGAGDLLAVLTPQSVNVSEQQMTFTCVDGYYLLKKAREGTAGFYLGSPRDVFEAFTKVWQILIADGFDTPNNYPGSGGVSTDNRWNLAYATASPVTSNLRLQSGYTAYVSWQAGTFTIGTGTPFSSSVAQPWNIVAGQHDRWRLECAFTLSSPFAAGDYINVGMYHPASRFIWVNLIQLQAGQTNNIQTTVNNSALTTNATFNEQTSGYYTLAIEWHDRWTYFYVNGELKATMPSATGSFSAYPTLNFYSAAPSQSYYVDLDYIVLRKMQPFLMQSSDAGDYSLPGAPAAQGLQATYFNDADIANFSDMGARRLVPATRGGNTPQSGSATTAVYGKRVEPTVSFPPQNPQAAFGPTGGTWDRFSVRFTGSIYLDLANHDYKLASLSISGQRLWVGKTRFGEQLTERWTLGNTTPSGAITWLTPSLRSWLGNVSGWYPLIFEFAQFPGPGGIGGYVGAALAYRRDDMPGLSTGVAASSAAVIANAGGYAHAIIASAPLHYWMINDPEIIVGNSYDVMNPGTTYEMAANLTTTAAIPWLIGPIPSEHAMNLGGGGTSNTQYLSCATGNTTGYTGVTIEAWINPSSLTNTYNEILSKTFVAQLDVWNNGTTAVLRALFGNGTGWTASAVAANSTAIPLNTWTHVAVTYNVTSGVVTLYINGSAAATSTVNFTAGAVGSHTDPLVIGATYSAGAANNYFLGGIAHVAFYNAVLPGATILAHFQAQTSPTIVPLSPQGVFEQQVRNDSHYEQMRQFAENWGYQFTARPQSLESGAFPALMAPRVREGHDTDYVVDHENALQPAAEINADDTADTLIVDAQGLADPNNSAQLYAEVFNLGVLSAGSHLMPATEYDSPGDIETSQQMIQRASSLLALRSSPWTNLSGGASGKREYTDTFPVTGNWQEFAWLPGDGLRYELPLLGVEDQSTRQLYSVQWPIFPDGIAAPTVTVAQRPRNLKETLRRVQRAAINQRRNYQGQFVLITGSPGSTSYNSASGPYNNTATAPDQYTRLNSPANSGSLVQLVLVVQAKTAALACTIEINGASTGITVTGPGRYDITTWAVNDGTLPRIYARLTSAATGTDGWQINLEALRRV